MIKREVSWIVLKGFVDTRSAKLQYIDLTSFYLVWASVADIMLYCEIPIDSPANSDQSDFESNYKDNANQDVSKPVETVLEKNDKDLKMAKLRADTDPATGIAVVQILCPGTPGGANEGRYIQGAEAFFTTAHPEDMVTKAEVVDVDNILGFGADTVVKCYHDDEADAANQGWFIGVDQYDANGNASFIEVKPLGGYAFLPAGLYLRITGVKDPSSKTSTFYVNLLWGKYSV